MSLERIQVVCHAASLPQVAFSLAWPTRSGLRTSDPPIHKLLRKRCHPREKDGAVAEHGETFVYLKEATKSHILTYTYGVIFHRSLARRDALCAYWQQAVGSIKEAERIFFCRINSMLHDRLNRLSNVCAKSGVLGHEVREWGTASILVINIMKWLMVSTLWIWEVLARPCPECLGW